MKWSLLLSVLALAVTSGQALSSVQVDPADALNGVILGPDRPSPMPSSIQTVTVRGPGGAPVPGALVEVFLSPSLSICPGAVLSGTTGPAGRVALRLFGGGCRDGVPGAAIVKVDGVTVRSYSNAKSPDFDGTSADGSVNLADLVAFSTCFFGGAGCGCHDYNNDGATDLVDLIIFTEPFVRSSHCP